MTVIVGGGGNEHFEVWANHQVEPLALLKYTSLLHKCQHHVRMCRSQFLYLVLCCTVLICLFLYLLLFHFKTLTGYLAGQVGGQGAVLWKYVYVYLCKISENTAGVQWNSSNQLCSQYRRDKRKCLETTQCCFSTVPFVDDSGCCCLVSILEP